MATGMSGTHISSTSEAGRFTRHSTANSVTGASIAIEELRQVRAEVRLELVDALNRDLHDLGGLDLLIIRRAEAQELS